MTVQKPKPSKKSVLPVNGAAVRQGHPSWTAGIGRELMLGMALAFAVVAFMLLLWHLPAMATRWP